MSPFPTREARPASAGWNVLKTLAQTAVFWCFFLFLVPALILELEDRFGLDGWRFGGSASVWAGSALFVLGGALGLSSGITMAILGRGTPLPVDCPRVVVVRGPYRYLRNPMAVAGLAQGVGVGLVVGSLIVVGYALLGGPFWQLFVRPYEETDLERRFGEPYRRYRAAIGCWLPRFPGYESSSPASEE